MCPKSIIIYPQSSSSANITQTWAQFPFSLAIIRYLVFFKITYRATFDPLVSYEKVSPELAQEVIPGFGCLMCFLTSFFLICGPLIILAGNCGSDVVWLTPSLGVCHIRTAPSFQHLSHARSLWATSALTEWTQWCGNHSETNRVQLMLINYST